MRRSHVTDDGEVPLDNHHPSALDIQAADQLHVPRIRRTGRTGRRGRRSRCEQEQSDQEETGTALTPHETTSRMEH